MTDHFVMLWSDMLYSTINEHRPEVWKLFTVCLLRCDREGRFRGTVESLARISNMGLEETRDAMEVLTSPDPLSTSPDEDGKRVISEGPNRWVVVNYEAYRLRAQEERRRAHDRDRKRRERSVVDGPGHDADSDGQDGTTSDPYTSNSISNTNTGKKKNTGTTRARFVKPKASEVQAYLDERGETRFSGEEFCDGNEAKGWLIGRTRTPMKDWRAAVRTWQRERDRRGGSGGGAPSGDVGSDGWMYDTYRKACRDTHGNHSRWEEYLEASAVYPARQAPRFADWLKEEE